MPFSLREYLKQGTLDLHEEAEKDTLMSDLFRSDFSLESYRKILEAFYQLHFALEKMLKDVENLSEWIPDLELRMKTPSLQRELQSTEAPGELKMPFAKLNLSQAFGVLYVLEGSTLGGQVIQKRLRQNPQFENQKLSYYNHYGTEVGLYWQKFIGFLEKAQQDGKVRPEEVLLAARSVFQVLSDRLRKPAIIPV